MTGAMRFAYCALRAAGADMPVARVVRRIEDNFSVEAIVYIEREPPLGHNL